MGIRLPGGLVDGSRADGWLTRVQGFLHAGWTETVIDSAITVDEAHHRTLAFRLHPAAPDVQLVAVGPRSVELRAVTSSVGPGYHAHLCDLARALAAELGVAWDREGDADPTGFFWSGDVSALDLAVLEDLRATARWLLTAPPPPAGSAPALLGLDSTHRFEVPGAVHTPLGPRTTSWLAQAAEQPEAARDVFAWWEPGFGPRYELGRALAEMWLLVRWRPPISGEERALLVDIDRRLRIAHEREPSLELPWREWAELRRWIGASAPLPRPASIPDRPPIGYRRHPVRVTLAGGWSIVIHGSLAETWEGTGALVVTDGARTLRLVTEPSAVPGAAAWREARSEAPEPDSRDTLPESEPHPERDTLVVPAFAFPATLTPPLTGHFQRRAGGPEEEVSFEVDGVVTGDGARAIVELAYSRPDDEAWALAMLASLRHDA